MTEFHQPLPQGWTVSEDSNGRIFFINQERSTTQWEDPRLSEAELNKYERYNAPTVVKCGMFLYDVQEKFGFSKIDEKLLQHEVEKRQGTGAGVFIRKKEFQELVTKTLPNDHKRVASQITDRLFSLLDLKYEQELEFRAVFLGLIFLSPLRTYNKIQLAFLLLDTTRKWRLNQELLFVMFKTLTRLVENHRYRYKLAMSNRNLVSDVQNCLNSVKVEKGRTTDGTISFTEFIHYAIDDPLIIRTLSMLEKIQRSRSTIHHKKKCRICSASPIIGIRYKVEDSFSLCETCFWKGQETNEFKRNLHVTEYPTKHSSSEAAKEKVFERFIPSIKPSARPVDNEARKLEYIDSTGKIVPPPPPEPERKVQPGPAKPRQVSESEESSDASSATDTSGEESD